MRALLIVLLVIAGGCPSEKPSPSKGKVPDHIDTKIGPIKVTDDIPADAELMCSVDYKPYPRAEMHVVPTYSPDLKRYVGSYRCNQHWKAAIAETRARFAANPTDEEGAMILQVFVERGVTAKQLLPLTEGKPMKEALPAVLDALEAGKLELAP
jgi:hypothetical protein